MYAWHAAAYLSVLGNERRLKVLALLAGAGRAGVGLEQVVQRTGLSPRSARRHLDRLMAAGLARVGSARTGSTFHAEAEQLEALVGFLGRRLAPRHVAPPPHPKTAKPAYRSLRAKLGRSVGGMRVAEIAATVEANADRSEALERVASLPNPKSARLVTRLAASAAEAA